MDREQLADFLRGRRARLRPADAGLPAGTRRRTPGLRREEVARLAGISVDYYTRLEQSRGPHPSRQVLAALSRALRLHDGERDHLFRLAGEEPAPPAGLTRDVSPGIRHLMDRLTDVPAFVIDAKYDILAWNPVAGALMGDLSAVPEPDRNIAWRTFRDGVGDDPRADAFATQVVSVLRAAATKYPRDAGLHALVKRLRAGSADFERRWAAHRVCVPPNSTVMPVSHPAVGRFEVECEVLFIADRDQRLITYNAAPGSRAEEALRLLAVIGTQDMTPSAP
ncbi:helix-turn-helix transcriptional regulator [Rhizomonospora bruguierae]|uniref:helix-turn-helix transcriptional regulator n=1 Tax=Rhizomonospora bruguierae TaxID=1581705 RepID=UPI001BCC2E23|nr:helix-turn-helix transcriptional regulator [Micromonospora sp. NBRC 107566]